MASPDPATPPGSTPGGPEATVSGPADPQPTGLAAAAPGATAPAQAASAQPVPGPAVSKPASGHPGDPYPGAQPAAGYARRNRLSAADLARVAVLAALIAALGLPGTLTVFGSAVPITAQSLGVMLSGALLGARRGFLACLVFVALVAAGLPLLAGGRGGMAVLTGPTAGYLLAFPLVALVIGWLTERTMPRYRVWAGILINIVGGVGVMYACGVPVHAWRVDSGLIAAVQSTVQFLPGDLIKAVVAALVASQVHRAYPGLIARDRNA